MISVQYKINKFKIYSILVPCDVRVKDFLEEANKKHNKKFICMYSEKIEEFLKMDDKITEYSLKDSIFYLSEEEIIESTHFLSEMTIYTEIKDFQNKKTIKNSNKIKIYEVIHEKSNIKYFAEMPSSPFSYKKLPSVIHGSVTYYTSICSFNFSEDEKEMLLSKTYENGSLHKLLQQKKLIRFLDNTKRMIIFYGIASGMQYLLSIGFQFVHLTLKSIYLDDFLFPKISSYYYSGFKCSGTYSFSGTDFLLFGKFDADQNDVPIDNSYSILIASIIYEILLLKKPFKPSLLNFKEYAMGKYKPSLDGLPSCYKELIQQCFHNDPEERMPLDQIVDLLKTNPDFILDGVDKDIYYEYIRLIDEYDKYFENAKKFISFENFVSQKSDKFEKFNIYNVNDDEQEIEEEEEINELNIEYLNLNDYKIVKLIGGGLYGDVFKVESKKAKKIYSAKISKNKINKHEESKANIYREALIISQLNHPSVLSFIGYSPIDFNGKNKPVIMTEFSSNGSLYQLLELNRHGVKVEEWDDTKKLINIYGIASCMEYLHSLNVIHRDLKLKNILLDLFLYPKLANFCFSTLPEDFNDVINQKSLGIIGNTIYQSPEVINNNEYSKSSDVYAFSIMVYEIITCKSPYNYNSIFQIMTKVLNGERPLIPESTPECFADLIQICWSQEPSKRPTFSEIVQKLRTEKSFLVDVDENEYQSYINYIDEYLKVYQETKKILSIEEFYKELPNKVDIIMIKKEHSEILKSQIGIKYINLNNFVLQTKIGEGSFGYVYKLLNKKTNEINAGKITKFEVYLLDEDQIISHYREVEILSKLNHPCILKFIGYSPTNFEDDECPVIITEFSTGGTLNDLLKAERKGLSVDEWNSTTKLINIYGISMSMMYLHQLNIIHRDLKPDNILIDSKMHPKLADFGLSKILSDKKNNDISPSSPYNKLKGTLAYCAPEILNGFNYSKAGDVYAFGLIVYEIVTNEVPFNDLNNILLLYREVVTNKTRPDLSNFPIGKCYKDLIKSCWSDDPNERPTFSKIVDDLKNNSDFISDDIDESIFFKYVDDIDDIIFKQNKKAKNINMSDSIIEQNNENNKMQINKNFFTINGSQQKVEESFNLSDRQKENEDEFNSSDIPKVNEETFEFNDKQQENENLFDSNNSQQKIEEEINSNDIQKENEEEIDSKNGREITQEEIEKILKEVGPYLEKRGIQYYERAKYLNLISQLVIGSHNQQFASIQSKVKDRHRSYQWNMAYTIVINFLEDHNCQETLQAIYNELDNKLNPVPYPRHLEEKPDFESLLNISRKIEPKFAQRVKNSMSHLIGDDKS